MVNGFVINFLFTDASFYTLHTYSRRKLSSMFFKHSDCEPGRMCDGFGDEWRQPRCEPCSYLEFHEYSCDLDVDVEDFFDNSWFNSDFVPNVDILSDDISNIFRSQEDAMYCISEQYCKMTTPVGLSDECSLFKPLMEKANISGYLVLFIVSIIFAAYLYEDMKQAEVENALLDFIMSSEPADSLSYALFITRISNRLRRFLLPFCTAGAAAVLILSKDLSPKNITLNLLALIFVIEADKLIASCRGCKR